MKNGPSYSSYGILLAIAMLLCTLLAWSYFLTMDITVQANGRVVPSDRLKIVQNLEGGIVSEIHVEEGAVVAENQLLMRISSLQDKTRYQQYEVNYLGLRVKQARLIGEIEGYEPNFPAATRGLPSDYLKNELSLFEERRDDLAARLAAMEQRVKAKKAKLAENITAVRDERSLRELLQEELTINRKLFKSGSASHLDVIKVEKEDRELKLSINRHIGQRVRLKAEIAEAENDYVSLEKKYQSDALQELQEVKVKLAELSAHMESQDDTIGRREVRAPTAGVVNQLFINTIGGVVGPGAPMVEIVPTATPLIVEARIDPKDVGYLEPGQKTSLRLTAFDPSIFGSLVGQIKSLGADAREESSTGWWYFPVIIEVDPDQNGYGKQGATIKPGMQASVNVLTGTRTVFEYILKPLAKLKETALRER